MKITSGKPDLIARGTDSVQQYFFYSFQALPCRKKLCSWHESPKVLPPILSINLFSTGLANQVGSHLYAWMKSLLHRDPQQLGKEAAEGLRVPLASLSWAGKSYRAPHQSAIMQGKSNVF